MKKLTIHIVLIVLCMLAACRSYPLTDRWNWETDLKQCNVERISWAYKEAMLRQLSKEPLIETQRQAKERLDLTKELLKTIAILEVETGHYQ